MENIPYGDHIRQTMDISLPPDTGQENRATIAFCVHGGGWSIENGDKKDFEGDGTKQIVNANNLAYVSINYRVVEDGATYKEMLDDIHAAITYLKNNSNTYHVKTDKMFILGRSAGGHLGLLYTYSRSSPIKIACIASMTGPTDFLDPDQIALNRTNNAFHFINKLLGTETTMLQIENPEFLFPVSWYDASPVYHVNKNTVPTVLAYGAKDDLVSYNNAVRLNNILREYGIPHSLVAFSNSGHEMDKDPEQFQQYCATVLQFLNDYLFNDNN